MTPQEARDTLVQTVKDTAALLPRVTGWEEASRPVVHSCDAGSGTQGAKYGFEYGAPQPGGDHAADVKTVADYWRQLGMNVRIVEQGGPTVYATGGSVQGLSFSTAPGDYYIAGTSLCVPGDAIALLRDQ